ncbi:hypothetical protein G6F57_016584 [Rhizopus arrhizus]|nr:hypothetical protein G6F57_016584 [Rhizopus arrhizus]
MGRKPHKNLNLPPRMRARRQKSGRTFYYYDAGGKPRREIPLGPDMVEAVRKWADLERAAAPAGTPRATFRYAAQEYVREVVPTKAPRTQPAGAAGPDSAPAHQAVLPMARRQGSRLVCQDGAGGAAQPWARARQSGDRTLLPHIQLCPRKRNHGRAQPLRRREKER